MRSFGANAIMKGCEAIISVLHTFAYCMFSTDYFAVNSALLQNRILLFRSHFSGK